MGQVYKILREVVSKGSYQSVTYQGDACPSKRGRFELGK